MESKHRFVAGTVAIIVEQDAAERMLELADSVHVWAIDTEANRRAAETIWRRRAGLAQELSMTVFRFASGSPDEMVARELEAIDLHHGDHAQPEGWCCAEIFGARPTAPLLEELARYGFVDVEPNDSGFTIRRSSAAGRKRD